jgi:hypothetical protein
MADLPIAAPLGGCTGYAKKRRLLREHRIEMRIMTNVIHEHDLDEALEDRMVEETGNNGIWLGECSMDEDSDEEDPEATAHLTVHALRRESAGMQNMVQAVRGALECRAVLTDLERARMQLEDLRGIR